MESGWLLNTGRLLSTEWSLSTGKCDTAGVGLRDAAAFCNTVFAAVAALTVRCNPLLATRCNWAALLSLVYRCSCWQMGSGDGLHGVRW